MSKVTSYTILFLLTLASLSAHSQVSEIRRLQQQLTKSPDSTTYLDQLNRIGFLMHMKSADSALKYGIRGKFMADRLNYTKGKADAICNVATALFLKGLYSQALTSFTQALSNYEAIGDTAGAAQMLMNTAVVYEVLGDSTASIKSAQSAIRKATNLYPDSIVSMLYANYDYLRPKTVPDSSGYYLNRAEKIALRYKDERVMLILKQLKGEAFLEKNDLKKALPLIVGALEIAERNQWEYHEIVGLDYYARYFLKKNKPDSAIICYTKSYDLAAKNGFVTFKVEVLKSLLEAYKVKHDPANLARINGLLVSALQEEIESNKDFIGDYIGYANAQEHLAQMKIEAENHGWTILLLSAFAVLAIATLLFIYLAYNKLSKSAELEKALSKKISEQNDLLMQSDEFKGKLVSMLAHDFRSPLTSTLGVINLLRESDEMEKREMEIFYGSIETDIRNVLKIFDNILHWIKQQYSGYVAISETLPVRQLIEEAASMHSGLLKDKELSIVNLVNKRSVVKTDKEIIQFINRNLIHNAIKFSPTGGVITISADISTKYLIVSVKDEGFGMTNEQIQKLFSITSSMHSLSSQSAGVALTICKEFIAKLNGRIWVESGAEQGTTFYYALPL